MEVRLERAADMIKSVSCWETGDGPGTGGSGEAGGREGGGLTGAPRGE